VNKAHLIAKLTLYIKHTIIRSTYKSKEFLKCHQNIETNALMIKVENIHRTTNQNNSSFFFPVFKSYECQVDHRDTDLSKSRSLVSWYAANFSRNSWRKLYCYKRP